MTPLFGERTVKCVVKTFAFGFTPGMASMIMIGRSAPGDVRATMVFAGLASAAVGAFGVELTFPMTSPSHLLIWHVGPVVVAALAARVSGRAIFERVALAVRATRR